LIGHLQNVNTNNLIGGPMEQTLLISYLRAANFRQWLAMPRCPPILHILRILLEKAFWRQRYQERTVEFQHTPKEYAHYPINSESFARSTHHLGNSIIIYHRPSDDMLVPGSIQTIEVSGSETFCSVTEAMPLKAGVHDPFERYPDFPAVTFTNSYLPTQHRIPVEKIVAHAVRYEFSRNRAVYVNLSQ
ncbi:hypothetical protein DL96DRAFT_1426053, partial [Flagelloscypha sp. PMI_526]